MGADDVASCTIPMKRCGQMCLKPADRRLRLEPGIDLLNKPFTAATLATKIRELLDKPDPRRYTPASVMGHGTKPLSR